MEGGCLCREMGERTCAYQSCYMCVAGYFSVGDFLDGAVDCVEESFCFVGACHRCMCVFCWFGGVERGGRGLGE